MKAIHWSYDHLPPHLQAYSRPICELAREFERTLPQSAELNAGLRKLMEAKDCFVRAAIEVHGTKHGDRMLAMGVAVGAPLRDWSGSKDPVSGQPLPKDSPYSMAHVPVPDNGFGLALVIQEGVEVCMWCRFTPDKCVCGAHRQPEITEGLLVAVGFGYARASEAHRETCLATIGQPCNCDRGRSE